MQFLKRSNAPAMRRRYRTYRRTNTVYAFLFLFSFLLAVVLCTRFLQSADGITVYRLFCAHFTERAAGGTLSFALYGFLSLLPAYLAALAMGITVYAPLCGGIAVLLGAVTAGAYCRLLLSLAEESGNIAAFVFFLCGELLIAPVLVMICAFSAAVSFRIFAPLSSVPESQRPFGGTLFCGPYFARTINTRFLFVYLLFFLAFAGLLFSCCLLQAAATLNFW